MANIKHKFKTQSDNTFKDLIAYMGLDLGSTSGPWVAGGTARRLWCNQPWAEHDIDLFFANSESCDKTSKIINESCVKTETFESKNARTYKVPFNNVIYKVQCIYNRFYTDIFDIWKHFDFTVCCFATNGRIIIADPDAVDDVNTKTLRYSSRSNRSTNGVRIIKYGIYGFNPDKEILERLLTNIKGQTLDALWEDTNDYT